MKHVRPECGFYFIRHGETTANRDGVRSGGDADPVLTPLGQEQACKVLKFLRLTDLAPGLIITSPLQRTLETVRILNSNSRLDVLEEDGLKERRLGAWNGRSVDETQPLLTAGETPPGGESAPEFRDRILRVFHKFVPLYPRWPLIVASRGIARIVFERAESETTDLANCSLLRITLASTESFKISEIEHLFPKQVGN